MPSKPLKISVHDALQHSSTALPSTINALLRRPVPLDKSEAVAVGNAFPTLITKCIKASNATTFAKLLIAVTHIVSRAFRVNVAARKAALKHIVAHTSTDQPNRLFQELLNRQHSLRISAVGGERVLPSLLELIELFADDMAGKELLGPTLVPRLCSMLPNTETWITRRGLLGALLAFVQRSASNKHRVTSLEGVAQAMVTSHDIFFLIQCIEFMFRIWRSNPDVLVTAESILSRDFVEQIRQLPNSKELPEKIISMIEAWITEQGAEATIFVSEIRWAQLAQVTVNANKAYFGKELVCVFPKESISSAVTVPYASLRSVRLHKPQRRLTLRLAQVPLGLDIPIKLGMVKMDSLIIQLNSGVRFRQSPVSGWITKAIAPHLKNPVTTTTRPNRPIVKVMPSSSPAELPVSRRLDVSEGSTTPFQSSQQLVGVTPGDDEPDQTHTQAFPILLTINRDAAVQTPMKGKRKRPEEATEATRTTPRPCVKRTPATEAAAIPPQQQQHQQEAALLFDEVLHRGASRMDEQVTHVRSLMEADICSLADVTESELSKLQKRHEDTLGFVRDTVSEHNKHLAATRNTIIDIRQTLEQVSALGTMAIQDAAELSDQQSNAIKTFAQKLHQSRTESELEKGWMIARTTERARRDIQIK